MKAFHIQNNVMNSIYTGADEQEALEEYAYDLGYREIMGQTAYERLTVEVGPVESIKEVDIKDIRDKMIKREEAGDWDGLEEIEGYYGTRLDTIIEIINLLDK